MATEAQVKQFAFEQSLSIGQARKLLQGQKKTVSTTKTIVIPGTPGEPGFEPIQEFTELIEKYNDLIRAEKAKPSNIRNQDAIDEWTARQTALLIKQQEKQQGSSKSVSELIGEAENPGGLHITILQGQFKAPKARARRESKLDRLISTARTKKKLTGNEQRQLETLLRLEGQLGEDETVQIVQTDEGVELRAVAPTVTTTEIAPQVFKRGDKGFTETFDPGSFAPGKRISTRTKIGSFFGDFGRRTGFIKDVGDGKIDVKTSVFTKTTVDRDQFVGGFTKLTSFGTLTRPGGLITTGASGAGDIFRSLDFKKRTDEDFGGGSKRKITGGLREEGFISDTLGAPSFIGKFTGEIGSALDFIGLNRAAQDVGQTGKGILSYVSEQEEKIQRKEDARILAGEPPPKKTPPASAISALFGTAVTSFGRSQRDSKAGDFVRDKFNTLVGGPPPVTTGPDLDLEKTTSSLGAEIKQEREIERIQNELDEFNANEVRKANEKLAAWSENFQGRADRGEDVDKLNTDLQLRIDKENARLNKVSEAKAAALVAASVITLKAFQERQRIRNIKNVILFSSAEGFAISAGARVNPAVAPIAGAVFGAGILGSSDELEASFLENPRLTIAEGVATIAGFGAGSGAGSLIFGAPETPGAKGRKGRTKAQIERDLRREFRRAQDNRRYTKPKFKPLGGGRYRVTTTITDFKTIDGVAVPGTSTGPRKFSKIIDDAKTGTDAVTIFETTYQTVLTGGADLRIGTPPGVLGAEKIQGKFFRTSSPGEVFPIATKRKIIDFPQGLQTLLEKGGIREGPTEKQLAFIKRLKAEEVIETRIKSQVSINSQIEVRPGEYEVFLTARAWLVNKKKPSQVLSRVETFSERIRIFAKNEADLKNQIKQRSGKVEFEAQALVQKIDLRTSAERELIAGSARTYEIDARGNIVSKVIKKGDKEIPLSLARANAISSLIGVKKKLGIAGPKGPKVKDSRKAKTPVEPIAFSEGEAFGLIAGSRNRVVGDIIFKETDLISGSAARIRDLTKPKGRRGKKAQGPSALESEGAIAPDYVIGIDKGKAFEPKARFSQEFEILRDDFGQAFGYKPKPKPKDGGPRPVEIPEFGTLSSNLLPFTPKKLKTLQDIRKAAAKQTRQELGLSQKPPKKLSPEELAKRNKEQRLQDARDALEFNFGEAFEKDFLRKAGERKRLEANNLIFEKDKPVGPKITKAGEIKELTKKEQRAAEKKARIDREKFLREFEDRVVERNKERRRDARKSKRESEKEQAERDKIRQATTDGQILITRPAPSNVKNLGAADVAAAAKATSQAGFAEGGPLSKSIVMSRRFRRDRPVTATDLNALYGDSIKGRTGLIGTAFDNSFSSTLVLGATKGLTFERTKSTERDELDNRLTGSLGLGVGNDFRDVSKSRDDILSAQSPAIAQQQLQQQQQKSGLQQQQIVTTFGVVPFGGIGFGRPPREPPKRPKRIRFDADRQRPGSKKVKGYHGFVKSEGKFVRVTKKPSSRVNALSKAARLTDQSTSRQFKVSPTKKKIKRPKKTDPYFSQTQHKYRAFKQRRGARRRTPNNYIEKAAFAIDTPSERKGISLKGITTRKRQARNPIKNAFGI